VPLLLALAIRYETISLLTIADRKGEGVPSAPHLAGRRLAQEVFNLDHEDVSGPGVWVGSVRIGGPGVKIGDDVIVRVASRRRNKVKVQILVKRPSVSLEDDPQFELAREIEVDSEPR
jgi:hypothetical protein